MLSASESPLATTSAVRKNESEPAVDPEDNSDAPQDGLKAAARRTVELVLRTLQNRAELFGVELEEEGRWVVSALIWTAAAIFFAVLAITIITITVIMLVPAEARPWVMLGFSAVYLFLAISAIAGVKKHFQTRRPPLADTVNELKKDLDWIRPRE